MKPRTQEILYHLLPVAFWLLAIGCSIVFYREWQGYLVALLTQISVLVIAHIKRYASSVEECFRVALLLGIASIWLPSVLFLILPMWAYLIYQNLFSFRSFLATLLGLATVALWIAIGSFFSLFTYHFSLAHNVRIWIPVGAMLVTYIVSTIVRQTLRVR